MTLFDISAFRLTQSAIDDSRNAPAGKRRLRSTGISMEDL
jgi:hypothetical protein